MVDLGGLTEQNPTTNLGGRAADLKAQHRCSGDFSPDRVYKKCEEEAKSGCRVSNVGGERFSNSGPAKQWCRARRGWAGRRSPVKVGWGLKFGKGEKQHPEGKGSEKRIPIATKTN